MWRIIALRQRRQPAAWRFARVWETWRPVCSRLNRQVPLSAEPRVHHSRRVSASGGWPSKVTPDAIFHWIRREIEQSIDIDLFTIAYWSNHDKPLKNRYAGCRYRRRPPTTADGGSVPH